MQNCFLRQNVLCYKLKVSHIAVAIIGEMYIQEMYLYFSNLATFIKSDQYWENFYRFVSVEQIDFVTSNILIYYKYL